MPNRMARHLKCIEDILPEYSETGIRVRYFLEAPEEQISPFRNDLLRMLVNRPNANRAGEAAAESKDPDCVLQRLRCEVSRSRRYGNPLSVIMVRIKPGPQSGPILYHPSKIIAAANRLLNDSTRWADSVGRTDHWEFLLVLPETTAVAAAQLVQKIEANFHILEAEAPPARFSVQLGVADWHQGDDEWTLLRRAQHAIVSA